MNLSRRTFIASAALAPVACGVPLAYQRGTPVAQPNPTPGVRAPKLGRSGHMSSAMFLMARFVE